MCADVMASRNVGRTERPNRLQDEPRGMCANVTASRGVGRTERTDGHRTQSREMRMVNRMPGIAFRFFCNNNNFSKCEFLLQQLHDNNSQ